MKFKMGDHLQEIGYNEHGIVIDIESVELDPVKYDFGIAWYCIENIELGLVNHWVAETDLELHKQVLRENKLKELGI